MPQRMILISETSHLRAEYLAIEHGHARSNWQYIPTRPSIVRRHALDGVRCRREDLIGSFTDEEIAILTVGTAPVRRRIQSAIPPRDNQLLTSAVTDRRIDDIGNSYPHPAGETTVDGTHWPNGLLAVDHETQSSRRPRPYRRRSANHAAEVFASALSPAELPIASVTEELWHPVDNGAAVRDALTSRAVSSNVNAFTVRGTETGRTVSTTPNDEAVLRLYNQNVGNVSIEMLGRIVEIDGRPRMIRGIDAERNRDGCVRILMTTAPVPPARHAYAITNSAGQPMLHWPAGTTCQQRDVAANLAGSLVNPCGGERRHKRFFIREREILLAFYRQQVDSHVVGIEPIDLPPGCVIHRVYHDPSRACFVFIIGHESYDTVPDGQEPPIAGFCAFEYQVLRRAEDGRYDLERSPLD